MPNKSITKVTMEINAINHVNAMLKTQQTRLNTLHQFQQHGVTRANTAWAVANGRLQVAA